MSGLMVATLLRVTGGQGAGAVAGVESLAAQGTVDGPTAAELVAALEALAA